jgi:hypothetical protein
MPPRPTIGDMSPLGLAVFVFAGASAVMLFWKGVGAIVAAVM